MWKYIVKRLIMLIPIIIGVTFLVFLIMNIAPGDPGRMVLGLTAPQEAVDKLNAQFGINDPFFKRYFDYIIGIFQGDFGISWRSKEPVIPEIMRLFPTTLKICILSIILSLAVGIPIGILSAVKQYSLADNTSVVVAMILTCIPTFWLGLLLILLFAVKLEWLPAFGIASLKGYILPVVTLACGNLGMMIRIMRSTMLEVIRQDYIRTARAKGATENSVIYHHAMKNALIPVITVAGTNFGLLLGGTVFVEAVFALPGLGYHILEAVNNKDIPVVMGSVIVLAVAFTLINLIVDIAYAYLDPRIKSMYR